MKQIIKDGQTLADVAVEHFGSWEAMIEIARLNGLSLTDSLPPGTELMMPDAVWNRTMEQWCRNNEVSPATFRGMSGTGMGIFAEEFSEEFN